ncbi:r2r3-myb transcription factor, putative [Ricinus communis]|uniref:R2r3-myb transcription factor, putative n=1 Tax=Ricinus communis TaxID=3988 RepID=B9RZW0_RICCO|nr:r2r3-myb transcription factor, putative [Ricinus communis]
MDVKVTHSNNQKSSSSSTTTATQSEDEMMSELRRGPWTVEEDFKLINYIATQGEGRWNSLARSAAKQQLANLSWIIYNGLSLH